MHTETLIDERRRLERHPCNLHVTCTPCANGSQVHWPGKVLDLSLSGIRLVVGRRFETGTLLRILLRDNAGGPLAWLVGRVIHLSAHADGQWLLGCTIVPQLTEEGLAILLNA